MLLMSDFVNVKGTYYKPGQAPKSWVDFITEYQRNNPQLAGQDWQSSWWGQPAEAPIPKANVIFGRRPDLMNTYKRKDRMETMPYAFDKTTMGSLLDAYRDARAINPSMPTLTAEQFTRLALEEGRSNFGYNQWDINNKQQQALVKKLEEQGYDRYSAGFAAAILDRTNTAKRLNRDFFEVWNGAGQKARNYNSRMQKGMYSIDHPDNQQLRDFIKNRIAPAQRGEVDETWMDNPMFGDEYA